MSFILSTKIFLDTNEKYVFSFRAFWYKIFINWTTTKKQLLVRHQIFNETFISLNIKANKSLQFYLIK